MKLARTLTLWFLVSLSSVAATGRASSEVDLDRAKASEDSPAVPLSDMLHRALMSEVRETYAIRRREIAAIRSPEDIAERQRELLAFFRASIGEMPPRTPLNPRIVGTLKREGYRVEKVIFESRPAHHVTANLYLPDQPPRYPGILLPCGHSDTGKTAEAYQRACILLAKNGMAVLCYDPIGQGERMQKLDATGKPVIRGTAEHTMAGIGALLVGRQLASYRVWDGIRALDYLESRPEIDPARLGCTGNSGGGTITAYLMALDERIAVAAPSCFITSVERLLETIGPQDAEQNITGMIAARMEHADFIALRAPKPTLMTVGTRDFFDIRGSWDTFREVKLIYGRLGFGERVDLFESDEEHGFTRPRRVATARWMLRWLGKRDEAIQEANFHTETDADLQCTRTGQVLTEFADRSVFQLNAEQGAELRREREARDPRLADAAFRTRLKALIGLGDVAIPAATLSVVGEKFSQEYTRRDLVFSTEPGITLPAIELIPRALDPAQPTTVFVFDETGQEPSTDATIGKHLRSSGRTIVFSPRGMGATTPGKPGSRQASPFGADLNEAFIGILQGRPLLGRRVSDILAVIRSVKESSTQFSGIHLVSRGAAGPVALHAAYLADPGTIKRITIEQSLVSWSDVVERGLCRNQLGNVVPGVLTVYDLPELAARLAPCPLVIHEPVDAMGQPIDRATAARAYAACATADASSGRFELRVP